MAKCCAGETWSQRDMQTGDGRPSGEVSEVSDPGGSIRKAPGPDTILSGEGHVPRVRDENVGHRICA
jgi:hypothetical protein